MRLLVWALWSVALAGCGDSGLTYQVIFEVSGNQYRRQVKLERSLGDWL